MDKLLRFHFPQYGVRGQVVRLDEAWAPTADRHRVHDGRDVSPNLRQRLGELSAAGLLLGASLKFNGALVLQIHSQGPVSLFVVECDSESRFRSTAKIREGARVTPDASLLDMLGPTGQARFVVTLIPAAPADRDARTGSAASADDEEAASPGTDLIAPYQGIVAFEGETIAELLENYMVRSEQIPTRLWLAADDRRAFGLLLQKMPSTGGHDVPDETNETDAFIGTDAREETDAPRGRPRRGGADSTAGDADEGLDPDGWNRVLTLAQTLTRAEMLELPATEVLRRLFWECPMRVFDARTPRFRCTCSRRKVESMLRMLGRDEVASIVRERATVEVRCEFCAQAYRFEGDVALGLFEG